MNPLAPFSSVLLITLAVWTIPWKVYAVWLAVKHNQKKWFVALLILNTFAILEIYYVFYVLKKSWSDVKEDFQKAWNSIK